MNERFSLPSFVLGVCMGIAISIVIALAFEISEDRHARRMEEIKEFAAMAPLAAMIYKAQNGN
jgi:predicted outer membrane lipoprotein